MSDSLSGSLIAR